MFKYLWCIIACISVQQTYAITLSAPDIAVQGQIVLKELDGTLERHTQGLNKTLNHTLQKGGIICVGTAGAIVSLVMLKNCIEQWKEQKEAKNIKTRVQLGVSLSLLAASIATILMSSTMIDYWHSA